LKWTTDLLALNYKIYLPIFLEGLREKDEPYVFLADKGSDELIEKGGEKVVEVLPQLILPLKSKAIFPNIQVTLIKKLDAMATKDNDIMAKTLKKIQKLVLYNPSVGEQLVLYYRQLLPVFNLFKHRRRMAFQRASLTWDQ
jgi:hypothetical protein